MIIIKKDPAMDFIDFLDKHGGWLPAKVVALAMRNWLSGCFDKPAFALQAAIESTFGK